MEWPHDIRARLAGYMLTETPEWVEENSTFREELVRFAETRDYGPENDSGPIPDELQGGPGELPENPFENDAYDEQMASAYIVVWANGEDPEEIDFSEVSDLGDFRWWVEKTGDLEQSIRAHHFGRDVPIEVVRRAAAPDEWTQLEPELGDNQHECESCSNVFYEIETPDGIESVTASGESYEGRGMVFENPDTPVYPVSSGGTGYVCPNCYDTITSGGLDTIVVGIDENGTVAGMIRDRGVRVDIAEGMDRDDLAPVRELSDYMRRALANSASPIVFEEPNGEPTDSIELHHYHDQAAGDEVWRVFDDYFGHTLDEFADVVSGPAVVRPRFGNRELTMWVPSNRPEAVAEAKSFLKEPQTYV